MTEQEMLMVEAARRGLLSAPQAAAPAGDRSALPAWLQALTPPGAPVVSQGDVEGFQRGVARGLRDPIDAGAQLVTRTGELLPGAAGRFMTGQRENVEAINKQAETDYQAGPTSSAGRVGGNIIGSLPVAMAAPATLPGGIVAGAASSMLQPVDMPEKNLESLIRENKNDPSFWLEKLKQGATGAALGGAGTLVAKGLGRVLAPKSSPEVQQLMDAGATPTPGQTLGGMAQRAEEALTSVPVIGDVIRSAQMRSVESFNRAAIDKALKPIGQRLDMKTPLGREAIEEAGTKVSQAYDDLLPKLTFRADAQFVNDVASLRSLAQQMPKDRAAQFDTILRDQVLGKVNPNTGQMSGETLKEVESALGRLSSQYRRSLDGDQQQLGSALRELQSSLRGALQRGNPDQAAQLASVNEAYSLLLRVENAAGRAGSKEGVFSAAALRGATKQMDPSLRKRSFARGNAPMQDFAESAETVLGPKVPDSGTPFRLAAAYGAPAAIANFEPMTAAGVGTALLPYTPMGQRLAANLLARRPEMLKELGGAVGQMSPYVGAGLPAAGMPLLGMLGLGLPLRE